MKVTSLSSHHLSEKLNRSAYMMLNQTKERTDGSRVFGMFGHIWHIWRTYFGALNIFEWGIHEKIMQNAV